MIAGCEHALPCSCVRNGVPLPARQAPAPRSCTSRRFWYLPSSRRSEWRLAMRRACDPTRADTISFPPRCTMRRSIVPTFLVAALAFLLAGLPVAGQDKFLDKITQALPDKAPAQPKQPRKILIYSKTAGFRHPSIPVGIKAITMMGDKTGAYTALATEDESFFERSKLKAFDAVVMLNTTLDCLKPKIANEKNKEQVEEAIRREEMLKNSLEEFVANGKGLIGVHSATDTYHDKDQKKRFDIDWPAYHKMMGGAFVSHPWHQKVPVKNLDPTHPVNAAFDGNDFEITDEIYMFRDDTALPNERHYLLSIDTNKMDPKDVAKGKR